MLFLCYFLLLYFVLKKKLLFYGFFMYFLKINFRVWTTKLSLAVFYKIKKLAIIEIILLNITHLSFIFFYCLVYIYFFVSIISKQWIIWFLNIFWSFKSFNIWIFELFFCSIWNCLTNFLKAIARSSNGFFIEL